jgi:hypothetical protein
MDSVEGATSAAPGSPPITQTTFPACRAHYPGGPNRCLSVSSLSARPSPVNGRVGIHDFTFEACSSFTRVTACRVACPPKGGLSPEASARPVARPCRSVATMSYRQLHGWNLLPLVICAIGAHRQPFGGWRESHLASRLVCDFETLVHSLYSCRKAMFVVLRFPPSSLADAVEIVRLFLLPVCGRVSKTQASRCYEWHGSTS